MYTLVSVVRHTNIKVNYCLYLTLLKIVHFQVSTVLTIQYTIFNVQLCIYTGNIVMSSRIGFMFIITDFFKVGGYYLFKYVYLDVYKVHQK